MISYEPLFRTMKAKGITSYRLQKAGFSRGTYYAIKQGEEHIHEYDRYLMQTFGM